MSRSPADVKEVLVIAAASRSGSSFLHRLLARLPGVISLNGEGVAFEKLHGLGIVRGNGDSDAFPPSARADAVARDMLADAGELHGAPPPDENYLGQCVRRLRLQYPELKLDQGELESVCSTALNAGSFSTESYWLAVIQALGARYPRIELRNYDRKDTSRDGSDLPPPFDEINLEEPPFVVPQPRAYPSKLDGKTLLLKSSSDCYHLDFVRALFPKARYRFVALARNPAAAVSGLMDGWLSDGFYSRNVGKLNIKGYTTEERPWTKKWWKFDLPPGWASFRNKSLQEVCAYQWASANEHILRDLKDKLDVRYESLLNAASIKKEVARVMEFAGLSGRVALTGGPVMAVTPPAAGKWRKRRDILEPIVTDKKIADLSRQLGYNPTDWENWQ